MRAFPMILIAVLLYTGTVFIGSASGHDIGTLLAQSFTIHMFSGDLWKITLGDLFMALALVFLFIETIKATRTTQREIINHALSVLTFIGAMAELITLKGFSTSPFFFITAMCLFDVIAGYTISIITAKRDLNVAPRDEY